VEEHDLYNENFENKYHCINKMNSLRVLEKEKELCDKIIKIKKEIGKDYDEWEYKKDSIKNRNDLIMEFFQNQTWDSKIYQKKIKEQYIFEKKLLNFIKKDPNLDLNEKNINEVRIKNRIKIIEEELTIKINEKEENEKKKDNIIIEEKNVEEKKQYEIKRDDSYPKKVEETYHSVNKMNSLGVLEKELEICDKIISFKKEIRNGYGAWENKKDLIKHRNDLIIDNIQKLIWDFKLYKKKINEQYSWKKNY